MQPQVGIDVNEKTGVWCTDGLPMLYIPRHFMVNVHDGVEAALGRECYRRVLAQTGHRSAYSWCKQQVEEQGVSKNQVLEHYLQRLSVRGWGQFTLREIDLDQPRVAISLRNSLYVLAREGKAKQPVCYMFEGFFTGAIQYLMEEHGATGADLQCREIECQAMGFEQCKFELGLQ